MKEFIKEQTARTKIISIRNPRIGSAIYILILRNNLFNIYMVLIILLVFQTKKQTEIHSNFIISVRSRQNEIIR